MPVTYAAELPLTCEKCLDDPGEKVLYLGVKAAGFLSSLFHFLINQPHLAYEFETTVSLQSLNLNMVESLISHEYLMNIS